MLLSFHRERSGRRRGAPRALLDVLVLGHDARHGVSYDTHIPLMVMGPGIRPGRYDGAVVLNDLAPTLATLLGIETPSGASGRALSEILVDGLQH